MSEYNVRAGDNDSSYGTFSTLEAAERALRMVQRHDPEARIVVKYDWQARALMAEAAIAEVREIHRIVSPHWRPKTLREKLCQQEWSAPDDETREAIARLIATLDRHRPLGSDGKHGDLHTATCGCELDGVMRCQHCGHDYPCPTIRALDGDGDE